MKVLVSGAAGNMGRQVLSHLIKRTRHHFRTLLHRQEAPVEWRDHPRIEVVRGNLDLPSTLVSACRGMDAVISTSGVLFKAFPARFLERTNFTHVKNLADAAADARVKKFLLFSFPHVTGESTPQDPAKETLDCRPNALHSRTRWMAEKYIFELSKKTGMKALSLRAGYICGPEMRLVKGARFLLKRRLMAIWPGPTWIHLISMQDFLHAVEFSLAKPTLAGVINVCDDKPLTLQDFLDRLAAHWGYARPMRLPAPLFWAAALATELATFPLGLPCPMHRDLVKMGMTSSVADTRKARKLFGRLKVPSLDEGLKWL